MTLIISWIKPDSETNKKTIWTLSDGKIMTGDRTLTLEGSKILELHLRCKYLKGPPPREIYYRSSIGFAYAGSSLVGLNTFATLADIVSNLGGDKEKNDLPSHQDISEKAKLIIARYTSSIQSVCEILLFGFCPKTNEPFISKIAPKKGILPIEFEITEVDNKSSELQFVLLGDQTEKVASEISLYSKDFTIDDYQYWKTPTAIFYHTVKTNQIETVGGGMSLAIAYENEFQMTAISTPAPYDSNKATLAHKNFDIFDDIGIQVGDCKFAIDGMDIGISAYLENNNENEN